MKKLMLIALAMLVAVGAFAQPPDFQETIDVSVTIDSYCSFSLDDGSLSIAMTGGDTEEESGVIQGSFASNDMAMLVFSYEGLGTDYMTNVAGYSWLRYFDATVGTVYAGYNVGLNEFMNYPLINTESRDFTVGIKVSMPQFTDIPAGTYSEVLVVSVYCL